MSEPTAPARPASWRWAAPASAGAPVMVLVHGATQDMRTFGAQVEALAPTLRLLLVDLPGHGGSSEYPGPYDFDTYIPAVLAAIDSAGVERFHYFGTHTGAGIGLALLERCPQRLRTVVLEGPVLPDRPLPSVVAAYGEARAVARRDGVPAARAHWFDTAPWFGVMRTEPQRCRAAGQRAIIESFSGKPWLDDAVPRTPRFDLAAVARAQCPVLILNGAGDVPDFLELAGRLAASLPVARAQVIEGGGGFPHWEVPVAVNAAVLAFVNAHPG